MSKIDAIKAKLEAQKKAEQDLLAALAAAEEKERDERLAQLTRLATSAGVAGRPLDAEALSALFWVYCNKPTEVSRFRRIAESGGWTGRRGRRAGRSAAVQSGGVENKSASGADPDRAPQRGSGDLCAEGDQIVPEE